MNTNPIELTNILQRNETTTIVISQKDFFILFPTIKAILGDTKGFIYIIDNKSAMLFFSKANNVSIRIKLEKKFDATDFRNIDLKVFGSRVKGGFFRFLFDELFLHWKSMLIILLLLGPFLLIQGNNEFIKELNTALISCMAILIGVFLVFMTFFYLGKEHEINYFTHGTFSDDFKNDRYIIYISMLTVVLSLISIGLSYYKYDNSFLKLIGSSQILILHFKILSLKYNNAVSGITTLLGIMTFWLAFRAMTDYYFYRISNQISFEAIKNIRKEFFKNND